MALMEKLVETLGKLPETAGDDFKKEIKALFQEASQEAGRAKNDLETYKKGSSDFAKLKKRFEDLGMDMDRLEDYADATGVKKTLQDEVELYKESSRQLDKKLKEAYGVIKSTKMENVIGSKIAASAANYKTPEGKPFKIDETFIDKKELYKDIDLDSDVLVQERITNVLKSAFEKQSAFMQRAGVDFVGTPVHKVPNGESTFGSGKVLDTGNIAKVISQNQGSADSVAWALTQYEKP